MLIHNANLLGAALCAGLEPGDPTRPGSALRPTLAAQATDGSWPYGAGAGNLGFVDSFHSGYVLSCLAPFAADRRGRTAPSSAAPRYYTSRFFDAAGRAMLWPDRRYPEDAHSAGTALSTLTILAG